MDAQILNRDFQTQCIIDGFESFIWTDRYNEPGDFELYLPVERSPLEYIIEGWYVWIKDSDRLGIIEDISITTDAEEGPHIIFNGRTLESMLDRRIVYQRTVINGNLQDGIEKLLNENLISPSDSSRKIPNVRFIRSTDSRVTSITMVGEYLGEDLLTIVEEQCILNDLGFKMIFNEADGTFDFYLYYGEDRSYNQESLPWVVFSNKYENLVGSSYYESKKELRTAAMISGSDRDEQGQAIVDVDAKTDISGLDRRELYVDGSDIEVPEIVVVDESAIESEVREKYEELWTETAILAEIERRVERAQIAADKENIQNRNNFLEQLRQKGYTELAKTYITEAFEGVIEGSIQYIYGIDFFIGDVVQVHDQYGKEAASRITEVIRSHDVNGETLTPTFTTLLGGSNKGAVYD